MLFIAGCLPLPSVDQAAALAQLGRVSAWWAARVAPVPPAFSILAPGLLGLVVARFGLSMAVNPRAPSPTDGAWRATIASLFVTASFVGGIAMSLALHHRFSDLHRADPVLGALIDGAGTAVGAAVLWSLATLVRQSGVASGALLLFGAWELARTVRFTLELIAAALAGEGPLLALSLHTGLVPLAVLMLALWRWVPGPYPIGLWRGLTLRGPLDLLVLPLVAGGLASIIADDLAGYPSWTPQPPLYDPGLLARTLAGLLVVPAIGAWVRRVPGRVGGARYLIGGLILLGLTGALAALVLALGPRPLAG